MCQLFQSDVKRSIGSNSCLASEMKLFRIFSTLFVLKISSVLVQSSANHEENSLTRRKRQARSTCSTQKLQQLYSPVGAILKSRGGGNNSVFYVGEKAVYVCNDDFRQIGQLQSFICQENDVWKEYSGNQTGFCVVKRCNVDTIFCKNGDTIDACKECDCIPDCPDSSDEASCAPTLVDVTGKATGTLQGGSANWKLDTSSMTCNSWKLQTNDQGFYVKLSFKTFSMAPNCERNYVSLENANFTDPTKTAKCCKRTEQDLCNIGGSSSPPLSRTATNWMTIRFFSETNKSYFTAEWYNVDKSFPNGLIPNQDSTYSPTLIKSPSTKKSPLPKTSTPVLALVLFALILLVIGSILACKLGKRILGPKCSFRHCLANVLRRPILPEIPLRSHSAELPLEERALKTDTDSLFTEDGHRRLQATYLGDDSDGSWHGSSENMI